MTDTTHAYWCPFLDDRECCCDPLVTPTEVNGLKVGDNVMINNRWPATVTGFLPTLRCDVVIRWTGKRPTLEREVTLCRRVWDIQQA